MVEVGIVIVTYNSAAVIEACLDSAVNSGAEVVVIDNASSDNTVEKASRPGVQLIANRTNRGFAGAVNQGFSALKSPYIMLLNPDTVLQTSFQPLREACDLPCAAGAAGRIEDAAGNPQVGFMVRKFPTPGILALESLLLNRAWPGNTFNADYRAVHLDYSKLQAVDQPAGAFLMIRRSVWEQLDGFDEQFWPLWFEDVDFCRRAAERGYLWYYVPQAVCKHTGAHSISKLTLEMRQVYWYRSLLRYSAKHFRPLRVRAVCLAVIVGAVPRALIETALRRSCEPLAAYGKVMWLAGRFFFGREGKNSSVPGWLS
jgi:N-acetylglucosaminyl-diphospho-decaprenol L-rhamnosyltransferase